VQKLDLRTTQEMEALEAFKSAVPSLFTDSGQGMYGNNDSAFSQFPKYKTWKANSDKISYSISNIASGLNNHIDMKIQSSYPVNPILKLTVSLSTQFLQKYIYWLANSYDSSIEAGLSNE